MERNYIIPLRKEWMKAPGYKRTKRAVSAVRIFLKKHMKHEDVKLGRHLNMALWARGNRNPPHKIEVNAEIVKDKDGDYVYAELVGKEKEQLKFDKIVKKEGLAGKLESLTGGDKKKVKEETKKEVEKKEAEKIIKESPLKEKKVHPASGVDTKPEVAEKAREENLVKRDMKEQHDKKA
tara:strand:- start:4775 stop:5311 length:537 start_codon:yes stop_codon:yes gene_type:complete